jgi:type IV secretory pathway VirB3-like protein
MRKSTASRIVHLILAIGFTVGVASLAFIWSLNNTITFTRTVMLDETWGTVMGLVIQFGPQVFLALASTASGTERTGWFAAFFMFSGIDAATNIGATMAQMADGVQMTALQLGVRIFIDIIIVFGEEMVGYGIAVVFHDVAELIENFGERAPRWMFIAEDAASRLATGHGTRSAPSGRATPAR